MDREAWRAAIHGVTKSRTRLSDRTELKKSILLFVIKTIFTNISYNFQLKPKSCLFSFLSLFQLKKNYNF